MSAARPLAIPAVTIGPGTAALVVVAVGIVVLLLAQQSAGVPRTDSDIRAMFEELALRPIESHELVAGRDLGARSMRSAVS
jgi:hypothetical protein